MFPLQPFVVLWLASATAQAVILPPSSVDVAAPFSNISLIETSSVTTIVESAGLLPVGLTHTVHSVKAVDVSKLGLSKGEDARTSETASTLLSPTAIVLDATDDTYSDVDFTPGTATPTAEFHPTATASSAASAYENATSISSKHASNASCIVNIPSATLDSWYPPTYSYAVGTMTTEAANFSNAETFTLVPQTTTFDMTSALATDYACTTSFSYISAMDWTFAICMEYTEKPVATLTSIAYRSAYLPFPAGNTAPVIDALLYDIYTDGQPPATTTLSVAPNSIQTQTSSTPFVHFTGYEIESGNRTETIQLQSAFVYPYWFRGIEQQVAATGPLPEGFLEQIPQSACGSGQLQAVITVVIVVDLYYQNWPNANPFIIHFESTALGFDDTPVIINNNNVASSKHVPFTVADWDLTSLTAKPVPTHVKPQVRPDSVPTTTGRAQSNNGNSASSWRLQTVRFTAGTIGTLPVVVGPSSQVMLGSRTLQPGAAPITVGDGTPVSLVPSATAIVVGGITSQLPQLFGPGTRPPPILTIGSSTFTPNAATQFLIAPGQTLSPGGVVSIDGTRVSLAPSASFVVIGGFTHALQSAAQATSPPSINRPQIIIGGSTITAEPASNDSGNSGAFGHNPNNAAVDNLGPTFIVSGQTLAPGGSAITVSGTVFSLAPSASFLIINGATSILPNPGAAQITAPPLTIGERVFSSLPGTGTEYLIFSMLLTPGGSIIVAGTRISLALGATALIVNGRTSYIRPQAQPITTNAPLLTLGSRTYTAVYGTTFIIDGQTLTPGGIITVHGTTVSLAPGATELVLGSAGHSTSTALFPATTTQSQSLTRASNPSAGSSGGDGRAVATSSQRGAAILLHARIWTATFVTIALGMDLV